MKKAEEEKADTDAWAKLSPRQQADREKRIVSVRHTAQAFLGLGKLTLATLLRLATDSVVGRCFTDVPDRAKKMVAMLIKFLTTLTTNPSELNVKDRDKLGKLTRAHTHFLLLTSHTPPSTHPSPSFQVGSRVSCSQTRPYSYLLAMSVLTTS